MSVRIRVHVVGHACACACVIIMPCGRTQTRETGMKINIYYTRRYASRCVCYIYLKNHGDERETICCWHACVGIYGMQMQQQAHCISNINSYMSDYHWIMYLDLISYVTKSTFTYLLRHTSQPDRSSESLSQQEHSPLL